MSHTPGKWDRQGATVFALDELGRVNRFSAHVQGGYVNGGSNRAFGDAPERTSESEIEANARMIAQSEAEKLRIRFKWLRRLLFRWAFKGCAAEHPEALAYARKTMGERTKRSIENEIRMERALVLDWWARRLRDHA